ncbi:MAG: DUF1080 domain-containing protein [Flavobacteriaceae bacterium]
MGRLRVYPTIALIISFLVFACGNSKLLFKANSSTWIQKGNAQWQFTNNEIVGSVNKGAGFVMTKLPYQDFELELEFFPDPTVNSGIFIRCKDYALSYTDCYEINIWDDHPKQKDRTGAIVSRSSPHAQVQTIDQWNTYKIRCENNHIQAWINDIKVADLKNDELKKGYIGLQAAETGTVKFRNVRLRAL